MLDSKCYNHFVTAAYAALCRALSLASLLFDLLASLSILDLGLVLIYP